MSRTAQLPACPRSQGPMLLLSGPLYRIPHRQQQRQAAFTTRAAPERCCDRPFRCRFIRIGPVCTIESSPIRSRLVWYLYEDRLPRHSEREPVLVLTVSDEIHSHPKGWLVRTFSRDCPSHSRVVRQLVCFSRCTFTYRIAIRFTGPIKRGAQIGQLD